jgi:hypothetical protein
MSIVFLRIPHPCPHSWHPRGLKKIRVGLMNREVARLYVLVSLLLLSGVNSWCYSLWFCFRMSSNSKAKQDTQV